MSLTRLFLASLAAACCLAAPSALAQQGAKPPTTDDCLACHGDPSATGANNRSVAVKPEAFAASIHSQSGLSCVDCHRDLATMTELPHPEKLQPVNCATCHEAAVQQYDQGVHAVARRTGGNTVAASCKDCHGVHDIRPSSDPESATHHLTLAGTCGKCHQNDEVVKRGRIAGSDVSRFQDSIHGQALSRSGLVSAPNCADCHGFHDIKRKTDPSSRVFRTTVPETCGSCHEGIELRYAAGVHGTALRKGNPLAPNCVSCHTAHGIVRTESESWSLQVLKECGSCHAESVRTYRDTFHGQVTQLGFVRVATCSSCHAAHDIFPKEDPRSTVSDAKRVQTCGTCHSGASASFVKYDPHADRDNRERNPLLFYAAKFMHALLIGVFLFFGIHTTLWLSRSARFGRRGPRPGPPDDEGAEA